MTACVWRRDRAVTVRSRGRGAGSAWSPRTRPPGASSTRWCAALGATHHQASVEVHEVLDGGCRLVWTTDVLPDDLAPLIDGLMDQGAVAIARTLAG